MIHRQIIGLKGQLILAQGKRSDTLGLETGHENRPSGNVYKREDLISDEREERSFVSRK